MPLSTFSESRMLQGRFQAGGCDCYHFSFSALEPLRDFLLLANQERLALIPGKPRALPAACGLRQLAFIDIDGMAAIIEHQKSDQVISVQSGIRLGGLQDYLKAHNQCLAVKAKPELSLLELLSNRQAAMAVSGGAQLSDLVLGLEVLLGSGQVITCGGKVVKNVTGYDLTRLILSAAGTLGLILSANLRLRPKPEHTLTLCFTADSLPLLWRGAQRLLCRSEVLAVMEMVDAGQLRQLAVNDLPAQTAGALLLLLEGQPAEVEELNRQIADELSLPGQPYRLQPLAAEAFWAQIRARDMAFDSVLEITAAPGDLLLLLQACLLQLDCSWQLSPQAGHLLIELNHPQQKQQVLPLLQDCARQHDFEFCLAASSAQQLLLIEEFPAADAAQMEIKRMLKERFDPYHIFNPLVSL